MINQPILERSDYQEQPLTPNAGERFSLCSDVPQRKFGGLSAQLLEAVIGLKARALPNIYLGGKRTHWLFVSNNNEPDSF